MPEYKTLTEKVRYVIGKDPSLDGSDLVVAVWINFFWSLFEPVEAGSAPSLIRAFSAAKLPGPEKILAAAHRIRNPKPPPNTQVPMPILPYADN